MSQFKPLNRREFLISSAAITGWMVLGFQTLRNSSVLKARPIPGRAIASIVNPETAPLEPWFFVQIHVNNGMDATLGLDPQVHSDGLDENDVYLEYRADEILRVSETLRLGPSAAEALRPFGNDCLAINGIVMRRDAGHTVGTEYALSGKLNAGQALAAIHAMPGMDHSPLGFITITNGSSTNLNTLVPSTSIESVREYFSQNQSGPIEETQTGNAQGIGNTRYQTPLTQAQSILQENTGFRNVLIQASQRVRGPQGDQQSTLTDSQVVAASFAAGGCTDAFVLINGQLDTHTNHPVNHLREQRIAWEKVASYFRTFKEIPFRGRTLFDYTTFLVTTEFSRTPALNPSRGKDHNAQTNSFLLAGKGIRGGRSLGRSRIGSRHRTSNGDPLHMGVPFNFESSTPLENPRTPSFIFPENVAASIAHLMNFPQANELFANTPRLQLS